MVMENKDKYAHFGVIFAGLTLVVTILVFVFGNGVFWRLSAPVESESDDKSQESEAQIPSSIHNVTGNPNLAENATLSNDEINSIDGKDKQINQIEEEKANSLVSVPNVVGMEQNEAIVLLTDQGLQFQIWWTEENNIDVDQCYIIDQSIPAESSVPAGTLVRLEVSPTKP